MINTKRCTQIREASQNRKTQMDNVCIDWNLSQDEAGSIDLSDEETVVENTAKVSTHLHAYYC